MLIDNNSAAILLDGRRQLVFLLGLGEALPDSEHAVDNDGIDTLLDLTLTEEEGKKQTNVSI